MSKRYQVFVSSTFVDLKDERAKVQQTIMESDCIPAGMEIFPSIDEEQFEFIKKVIDDCDYYLLIIGGRYGTLSDTGISYTEMEYDYAISKGIKVIAFIHSAPETIPLGKSEQDAGLREKLEAFKKRIRTGRLVKEWSRADELPGLVALSLSKTIKTYPAVGWVRADTLADPDVYRQMNELRKENQEQKEALAKLAAEKATENKFDDIAGLDDTIKVFGTYSKYSAQYRRSLETSWEVELTWGKLFALLAPYLINHPNDDTVKVQVGTVAHSAVPDGKEDGTATIDDQLFQTIRIQFQALALVEVKRTTTTTGGVGLFWFLTKRGQQQMNEARIVRKGTSYASNV